MLETINKYLTFDGTSGVTRQYWNQHLLLFWENNGGDWVDAYGAEQGSEPFATFNVTSTGWVEVDVTDLVRSDQGKGWMIRSDVTSGACDFGGRLSDTPPELIINGGSPIYPMATAAIYDSTVSGISGVNKIPLADAERCIVQFNVPSGIVNSAMLRLYVVHKWSGTNTGKIYLLNPPTFTFGGENPVAGTNPTIIDTVDWNDYSLPSTAEVLDGGVTLRNKFESIEGEDTRLSLNKITSIMLADFTDSLRPPDITVDQAHVKMDVLLEDDFTSTVDGNKAAIGWDLRMGYWVDSGNNDGGYWQATTGNGGSPGTGLKVLNETHNQWEYQGHSIRMEFGKATDDGNPYGSLRPIVSYVYHLDQPGLFGSMFRLGTGVIAVGEYFTIEQRIKMNSITGPYDGLGNGEAVADGEIETWLNGTLIQTRTNMRWRRHPEMGVQAAWYNWFFGGVSSPDKEMHYRVSDVVVADGYIGAGETTANPPSVDLPDVVYSSTISPIVAGRFTSPSYLQGVSAYEWVEVQTNKLSSVDPEDESDVNPNYPSEAPWRGVFFGGQSRVMSAWSGGQWDETKQGLYIFGGGHGDYAGNELYWWDSKTGLFSRITNPTGAIGNEGVLDDGQESTGVYFDGQPRSVHSYNNLMVRNGVLWNFGGSQYRLSTPSEHVFYFDETSNAWVNNLTNGGGRFGAVAYDPTRDKAIVLKEGAHTPRWIDCAAPSVGAFPQSITRNGYVQALYLASLDSYLVLGGSIKIAAADGSAPFTNISTTGSGPAEIIGESGYVWDSRRNLVLCWFGGQTIYTLTPPETDPVNNDWTWGTLPVSGMIPTSEAGTGTYGRFWYSYGLDCVGVVNRVGEHMFVCPLS